MDLRLSARSRRAGAAGQCTLTPDWLFRPPGKKTYRREVDARRHTFKSLPPK
jgi:hypothetical protein